MSTLKAENIQSITTGPPIFKTSAGTEIGQLSRAWVNFTGTGTVASNDSFNVSSFTDHGTGDYEIHFENAMPSANYVITGMVANTSDEFSSSVAGATRGNSGIHITGTVAPTAGSVRVQTRFGSTSGSNGAADDFSRVYVAIFGAS